MSKIVLIVLTFYWLSLLLECLNKFIFRFEKCLKMGMKLEAIREDRTRGGRSTYQCSYTIPQVCVPTSAPIPFPRYGYLPHQCSYPILQVRVPTTAPIPFPRYGYLPVIPFTRWEYLYQCFYAVPLQVASPTSVPLPFHR